ncbi:MAG: ATP-dependent transcriptional regulator, MalT-like, LuxR family [Frankiales bacterium]|nr:ATP-dependent transcriptional regulator, MalT-like, LuxR family [Frankiales bacterium]
MAGELLSTKLHMPRLRRSVLARPRLVERLSNGGESALTLVSASAGFGKTTLLTEWLSVVPEDRSVAWLSLDSRDSDPATFWAYVVAALQTAAPGVGEGAQSLLQSQAPMETVVGSLINDLHGVPNDIVLVLDDYHLIGELAVHEGMGFLLEHLPRQVHLVIASRADPALPLARLRSRGELVEVRAADLRFTPDEAAAYLNGAMGLTLTAADVAALEGRTEGWIAALQLAALSMQGRDDVATFIASFAGDDRFIVDYLIEEVLHRQTEDVRTFLLHTSILNGLSGALCDAVTARHGGKAMLEALDRANLFLVPLDDRRRWYRYHHLFADVLRARLLDEQPEVIPALHRRASDWYDGNGERSEAISHALAARDHEHAAELIERALPDLLRTRQDATLRQYLETMPDEVIRVRPVLSVAYVGALMVHGDVTGVEQRLLDAERMLASPGDDHMVVVDEVAFRGLPTAIAMYRAGQALVTGDVPGSMAHARRALDLVADDDHVGRGGPTALLGLAHWRNADLDAAYQWFADGMGSLERAGHLANVVGGMVTLADLRITQGRLRDAQSLYERGLRIAQAHTPPLVGLADMHIGLADLARECNDLDTARQHLAASAALGDFGGAPQHRHRWRVATAFQLQLDGDPDGARELLDEAELVFDGDFAPNVRPIAATRARLFLAQGAIDDAATWARSRGLSYDDDLSYLTEFEHITLAKLLVAQRQLDEAAALLGRLLPAAEAGGRGGSVLEVLVLQSLAAQFRGDGDTALAALRRAITLAEPEGYVRLFLDEGAPMVQLLQVAARAPDASPYARLLISAAGTAPVTPDKPKPPASVLVDPLSPRELDVLRLLGSDLDGPDIARTLVVSLNTVRTHTKNIYAKLGVTNRRAAVSRAADLGLLSR